MSLLRHPFFIYLCQIKINSVYNICHSLYSNQRHPINGEDILHDGSDNPNNKHVPIHQNKVKA